MAKSWVAALSCATSSGCKSFFRYATRVFHFQGAKTLSGWRRNSIKDPSFSPCRPVWIPHARWAHRGGGQQIGTRNRLLIRGAIMMITAGAKGVFLMKKLRRVKLKFSERGGTDDDESVSLSAVLPCRSFWNFRSASLPGHISTVTSHYRGRCTRVLPHVYSLALSLSTVCIYTVLSL